MARHTIMKKRQEQDAEIKNNIDLFINEEIENGRDPDDMSLKDTNKVYK